MNECDPEEVRHLILQKFEECLCEPAIWNGGLCVLVIDDRSKPRFEIFIGRHIDSPIDDFSGFSIHLAKHSGPGLGPTILKIENDAQSHKYYPFIVNILNNIKVRQAREQCEYLLSLLNPKKETNNYVCCDTETKPWWKFW